MKTDKGFRFDKLNVEDIGAKNEDISLSRDTNREMSLKTNNGLLGGRFVRSYKSDDESQDPPTQQRDTSVASARASAYLFCCCFYNCCFCLPERWFGTLCGKNFCFKQAICCEIELRRDRWLGLMHSFCSLWHFGWAIASFSAGAGKDMEVDIFRVKPKWNNTGRNGYGFEVVKDFEIRIDTVTGCFFLLSALFHSAWMISSIFFPKVWDWLVGYIDKCFCWWRFIEYSLSASLMLMAIGMITGLRDYNSMLGVFMLSFTTMFLGIITEMHSRPDTVERWVGDPDPVEEGKLTRSAFYDKFRSYSWRMLPHFIGWFPYITAWIIVLGNFFRQIYDLPQDQQDRIPWFVPWAIYGTAVVFTSFSFVQIRYQWTAPKHYWRSELLYGFLSLTAKTYLGGILYWNVILAGSFDEAIALDDPDDMAFNSTLASLAWHSTERMFNVIG